MDCSDLVWPGYFLVIAFTFFGDFFIGYPITVFLTIVFFTNDVKV